MNTPNAISVVTDTGATLHSVSPRQLTQIFARHLDWVKSTCTAINHEGRPPTISCERKIEMQSDLQRTMYEMLQVEALRRFVEGYFAHDGAFFPEFANGDGYTYGYPTLESLPDGVIQITLERIKL